MSGVVDDELRRHHRQTHHQPPGEEDADQAIVITPYGRGVVIRTRASDGMREIRLCPGWGENDDDDDGDGGRCSRRAASGGSGAVEDDSNVGRRAARGRRRGGGGGEKPATMVYTRHDYPSPTPKVGDDVICKFGRGRVVSVESRAVAAARSDDDRRRNDVDIDDDGRDDDDDDGGDGKEKVAATPTAVVEKYTVALTSWRTNGGRTPVMCHLVASRSDVPRPVRRRAPDEMTDVHERIEYADERKARATSHFADRNFALALGGYVDALDAIRDAHRDTSSSNEMRADLVILVATCSNNAATCCVNLGGRWDDAKLYARNALVLLDALYEKRGMKIHALLNRGSRYIDARLFGEWRVKSHMIVARSCMEVGEHDVASGVLRKAQNIASTYVEELNASRVLVDDDDHRRRAAENASSKALASQLREIRRLAKVCADRRRAVVNVERRRARAMFGGTRDDGDGDDEGNNSSDPPTEGAKDDSAGDNDDVVVFAAATDDGGEATTARRRRNAPPVVVDDDDGNGPRAASARSVSFSSRPSRVREYESHGGDDDDDDDDDDYDDAPWYSAHREALILLAVAGFSAVVLLAMRRSVR
ncbi:hypothetical protein ACHAW5_005465 [Stephanodiscus triporus]|uniref:Uncharacterized protein n=1 Tax=Stephanodiscus triporus TaxID=2934178 RepID=A0ABD3QFM8_9STRA